MKSILPIFAIAAAVGWAALAAAQTPLPLGNSAASRGGAPADSNSGDALLRRVVATVDAQQAIAAKVRERVELLGRSMVGSGIYLQQGRGVDRLLRFELNLGMTEQTGLMQQVCDGTNLWILEDLGPHKVLSWVDVARLRRARPKSQPGAQAVQTPMPIDGLPKLLANIESSFRFGLAVETRLEEVRVWTIEGQWKPERLFQLAPEQKEAIDAGQSVDLSKVPPNVPDRVVLQIGCDDFFPYRIEYWRGESAAKASSGDRGKQLALMEFYEVRLGATIDPRQFAFRTPALKPIDRTQEFLDRLGLEDVGPAGASRRPPLRR